jgi:hypothetical protein
LEDEVLNLYPLISFDFIKDVLADEKLAEWGHWLGGCNRPFGRQSFGLFLGGELVSVAVSASTVNAKCGGYDRQEVVELARLASHPDHRDMTRVCLRLWRKVAGELWSRKYWPVEALVSYSDNTRHKGDIYRFDGWKKIKEVPGGIAGGNWNRGKKYNPKTIWSWNYKENKS